MADRNSIYEVFRACRLCGGGGGYKMPIVTLEDELDMRHKIRECVRIEVHEDDKMPPLICELCVDKINDYFEFLQMCRATDSRTRQRLGLQQASATHGGSDSGDCILGVTEPVFVNDDSSDVEPLARQKNRLVVGGKGKKSSPQVKKEEPIPTISIRRSGAKDLKTGLKELKVNINGTTEPRASRSSGGSRQSGSARSTRNSTPSPSPSSSSSHRSTRRSSPSPSSSHRSTRRSSPSSSHRSTRRSSPSPMSRRSRHDKDNKIKQEKETKAPSKPPPAPAKPLPRSVLKKTPVPDALSLLEERRLGKRRGEERGPKKAEPLPAKRVKIAPQPLPEKVKFERPKPEKARPEKTRQEKPKQDKSRAEKRKPSPPPAREAKKPHIPPASCGLCASTFAKQVQLNQHLRTVHSPTFTQAKLACNSCGEWFASAEETNTHHRWHKNAAAYTCRFCTAEFKQLAAYNKHFANKQCVPLAEVPDEKCADCWSLFPTKNLLEKHKCRGEEARPGGACQKCNRKFASHKSLKRHKDLCLKPGPKRKGEKLSVSPEVLERVVPIQIRMERCDSILPTIKQEQHYDVSHLDKKFGLDKNCVYPYIASVRSIKQEYFDIKQEIDEDSLLDYESYTDSDSEPELIEEIQEGQPKMVVNPFARKKKSIDALSTLSIKAIFSPKLLGRKKIQRKRKKRPLVKPEIKEEIESKDVSKEMEEINTAIERADGHENQEEVRQTVDDLIAGLCSNDEETSKNTEKQNEEAGKDAENCDYEGDKDGKSRDNSIGHKDDKSSDNSIDHKDGEKCDTEEANNDHKECDPEDDNKVYEKSDAEDTNTVNEECDSEDTNKDSQYSDDQFKKSESEKINLEMEKEETCNNLVESISEESSIKETLVKQSESTVCDTSIENGGEAKSGEYDSSKSLHIDKLDEEIEKDDSLLNQSEYKDHTPTDREVSDAYSENNCGITNKSAEKDNSNVEISMETASEDVSNCNSNQKDIIPQTDVLENSNEDNSQEEQVHIDKNNTESKDNSDDFDINCVFSGDLGATAMKAQGKLKTNSEIQSLSPASLDNNILDDRPIENESKIESTKNVISASSGDKSEINEKTCETEKENRIKDSDMPLQPDENPTNAVETQIDSIDKQKEDDLLKNLKEHSSSSTESCAYKNVNDSKEITDNIPTETETRDESFKENTSVSVKIPLGNDKTSEELFNEDMDNISDTEMDHDELMEEIDAQISDKPAEDEKISLDDLLQASAQHDKPEKNDNIDSEFNFDV